ncbi:biopolymer transport protein ExbB [Anaerospora hongkongensis]|uniref:Biopolymer transport protein ExbB n=2 Tax=Anaerospora hongkongensis TaxID=244830 RepID=A0A4R1Q4Y7_9FIRM|nr:MotA/TolQ/ExbB proton channel family protein [Anaerospora hongkongensis]TCL36591.1 biopolymer transport protein ExbB [Anaerospora hongkongensis]
MNLFTQAIDLFHKGGPVMYLLAACSLFVVAIAVERILYYRSLSADSSAFQQKLQPLLEKQRFADAIQLAEHSPAAIAKVALSGLLAHQRGSQLENALESSAMLTAARLREHLDELSMVVTLAPLLGLLGTVIGMINSFSIFNVQAGQPMAITGGVGEALVATATGLSIATLALIIHGLFSRHVNHLVTDIEQTAALVISYVLIKKTSRRDAHEIA